MTTKSTRNAELVQPIDKGEPITGKWLSGVAAAINRNTRAVSAPRQTLDNDDYNQSGDGTSTGAGLTDLNFTETSRTVTTTTITTTDGATFNIDVIDSVTLQNGSGDVMTLTFTN